MKFPALPARLSIPLLLLALAGLSLSWTVERGSVQRGNRLHRQGAQPEAASIYSKRVVGDSANSLLRYNLGTTLLGVGVSSAGPELAVAAESPDVDVRTSGLYNFGLWNLVRAMEAESADTARVYTLASVEASKGALRLSPGRDDARWNLAIAQRMLDSIESSDGRAGTESVDGRAEADELVRTDETQDLQDESPIGDGPQDGEEETLADSDVVESLTILEADDILGSGHLDSSTMMRKLIAFEGRAQRRTRIGRTTPRW
ncbi:MAG: hypothetical protein OEO79_09350 [Gemmatimonadota bacterium]|nr:hypothetical protein [Gemmatimonadota bacterium]MDH3422534.1 hypothetical protein [Gemmatimonadota bacterium]